jgi:mannose/cellobiose epimerase-like protein (N-acyl-D-glucosamine 2-epimerase family)
VLGEAARHGIAFLMCAARTPDGGWFRTVPVEGAKLDNTRDTYDQAFDCRPPAMAFLRG